MKKLILIVGILLCRLASINAQPIQDYPYILPQYDFVKYDLAKLIFPGDSQNMGKFYNKMDKLIFEGVGKINIVHIGGSHVQADIVSGRLRERLQTFYPGNKGSRGLIFPFKVAGTNNPYNYFVNYTGNWTSCKNVGKYSCELGLTGMSITTKDTNFATVSIALKKEDYPAYDFNHIRIFHPADSNIYEVGLGMVDTSEYKVISNFTKGYTDIFIKKYYSDVQLRFMKTKPGQWYFTLYGIQLENDDAGITYHAMGVNGASTSSYLKCQLFEPQLTEIKPDLVIFGIGINDAAASPFDPNVFELNYRKLIERVQRANPDAAIIFITNNDSYKRYGRRKYYANQNALLVRESMLKLAKEYNVAVFDFFNVMGGLGSMATWASNGLGASDKIHFSSKGYKLMGDLMFNAILHSYEYHIEAKYPKK